VLSERVNIAPDLVGADLAVTDRFRAAIHKLLGMKNVDAAFPELVRRIEGALWLLFFSLIAARFIVIPLQNLRLNCLTDFATALLDNVCQFVRQQALSTDT